MTSLSDIPVRVEAGAAAPAGDPGGLGGGVMAILHELLALLERLEADGTSGAVDLFSMPMVPGDRERLREALGEGELTATFDSAGVSTIRETGVAGIWWIEHRDPEDKIVADLIEVTTVPELLVSQPAEVRRGARQLRQRLSDGSDE